MVVSGKIKLKLGQNKSKLLNKSDFPAYCIISKLTDHLHGYDLHHYVDNFHAR